MMLCMRTMELVFVPLYYSIKRYCRVGTRDVSEDKYAKLDDPILITRQKNTDSHTLSSDCHMCALSWAYLPQTHTNK